MADKDLCHVLGVGGLEDQVAGVAAPDLDVFVEHVQVAKALVDGGNGHHLRDGTEVEDRLVAQHAEVLERVHSVLEHIEGHLGQRPAGLLFVLGLAEVERVGDILAPDLFGPEETAVVDIFSEVTEDVVLLQEEAHRVGEGELQSQFRTLEPRGAEQHGEAFTDETGDIVAVEVELGEGLDREGVVVLVCDAAVVGHAEAHLAADGGDDLAISVSNQQKSGSSLKQEEQGMVTHLGSSRPYSSMTLSNSTRT